MSAIAARFAFAIVVILSALVPAQSAEKLSDRQVKVAYGWATNNALFIMYHEVAHMLVDQLNLPVLGKEEDAADNMASFTLLEKHDAEADKVMQDSAEGWLLYGNTYGDDLEDADFYDSHSLDKQRAFQIVCLMVGSDDIEFDKVADNYGLDEGRQDSCYFEYQLLKRSLEGVLGPHWRKSKKGADIKITYHAASGRLKASAEAFEESGIFERVADELKQTYALRNPISFRAKRCGEANAFYNPADVEIIFCYEMMDDLFQMISANMPEDEVVDEPKAAPEGLGREKSTPV